MSEQLEGSIAAVLRDRHAGAVDVTALRAGSMARARTIRRRRAGLTALAAVAVVAALVGMQALASVGSNRPAGPPPTGRTAPALPKSDQPGAAARPDLVAADPGTLHFTVDLAAIGAAGIYSSVGDGTELADVWIGGLITTRYYLARQAADLDRDINLEGQPHDPEVTTQVSGRTATLVRFPQGIDGMRAMYQITWQPADGLWARVRASVDDTGTAMRAVAALKLDRSQRCVVPFRLGALPAGYTWTGCSVSFGPDRPWETGSVELTDPAGNDVRIDIGNVGTDVPFAATTTVGDRPAQWAAQSSRTDSSGGVSTSPSQLFIPVEDWVNLSVSGATTPDHTAVPMAEATAKQLAELVTVTGDFADPASWPERPVG